MVMDYVDGGAVLAGGKAGTATEPLPEAVARQYLRDVVAALDYLHFHGIVHGDIKPDNMLLSSSGVVKLSDVGSARFVADGQLMTQTMGTPAFMAPEMCGGGAYRWAAAAGLARAAGRADA
jgi:serine/threonine protein kinase